MLCYYGDDGEEYRRFCRWKDYTKMNIKQIGVDVTNLVELAQDRDHRKTLVYAPFNL
jgi:hypothetical protein